MNEQVIWPGIAASRCLLLLRLPLLLLHERLLLMVGLDGLPADFFRLGVEFPVRQFVHGPLGCLFLLNLAGCDGSNFHGFDGLWYPTAPG